MRLSNVLKAACLRATFLLNQTISKKGYKSIQPELSKVIKYNKINKYQLSEIFGIEFDRQIFQYLFDDIDFKDIKAIQSSKNNSNKLQYFFHEINITFEKPHFVNLFQQVN